MPRKAHLIAIALSIVSLSTLIALTILITNAWREAGPIVDLRL